MSASNRSGPRWSSSAKSNVLLPARKKLPQPLILHQHTCAQRMAKTKHDVEQLFKIYYTSNIKFNTFEKHVVTGTRIPSAVQTPMINSNHLDHSSSNVFRSKHCVSREDDNAGEIDEHVIINDETAELQPKRSVQKRIDQQSLNNLTSTRNSLPLSPDTIPSLNDLNESLSEDEPIESIKRAHSTITALPSISSINLRKDFINSSDSSFSTVNTYQPHMITGSAVVVRERSPSKSTSSKQRIKSSNQHTNFKTSPVSVQYDQTELPLCLGARVVSIPSKCSRYVLLTFPQTPVRYKAPTYVERILLPERFPNLFQNIIHHRNPK